MPLVRAQIARQVRSDDPGRDVVVNTVYHVIADGGFNPSVDYQNHANEIKDLFAHQNSGSGSTFAQYYQTGLLVKVYDMADPEPRVPKATSTWTPTSWATGELAPRELACCLSFYGTNPGIKWQRGRIFIGPFLKADIGYTVPSWLRDQLCDLGHGLFDIGGENVQHVVHSPTHNVNTTVQNYWCNDLWDTMRSREQREGARTRLAP